MLCNKLHYQKGLNWNPFSIRLKRPGHRRGPPPNERILFACTERERDLYSQPTGPNPLNHRDDFSRPASRHGSLNSLFQVALYLPSYTGYEVSEIITCSIENLLHLHPPSRYSGRGSILHPYHTVDYEPFIKSQLTQSKVTLRPYVVHIGHVTLLSWRKRNLCSPPSGSMLHS